MDREPGIVSVKYKNKAAAGGEEKLKRDGLNVFRIW